MNCPSCGHVQPDGLPECQRCRIIFAKWRPRPTRAPLPDPSQPAILPADAPPELPRRPVPDPALIGMLAGLLLCGLVLWWVLVPGANPVPAGAYRSAEHRFAVSAPPDWLMLTRENMDQIVKEYGDRFSRTLRTLMSNNKNMAVSFVRLGGGDRDLAPTFNVVVIPSAMPGMREELKEEASRELGKVYASILQDYSQESIDFTRVDGLEALEIVSVGTLQYKIADAQYADVENEWGYTSREKVSDPEYARRSLKFRQILVPGRDRAYVVTFTALEKRWDDAAPAFRTIADSFRVLQRPPRFGPILNGTLIGGLVGAILGLMVMLIKRLGGAAS